MRFGHKELQLGQDFPCYVIAEIGVNHNNNMDLAHRMVNAAIAAGVDVIKFQAFRTEKEISRYAPAAEYQKKSSNAQSQLELCKALELSYENLLTLFKYCADRNAPFLCAAFEDESLDFLLYEAKVPSIKIASSEVTNVPFLKRIGKAGVDVVLSTGASTLSEAVGAVEILREAGCGELMVFHCVSEYPAPPNEVNLRAMETLRHALGCAVGFSDHTEGVAVPTVAAALGACAVEKHFTLDKNLPGPDHKASIEPHELQALVQSVRIARHCLGTGYKMPSRAELKNRQLIRKGLVAVGDLPAGTVLTREMLAAKRPAFGIEPAMEDALVGMRLCRAVEDDAPITWECVKDTHVK